VLFVGVDSGDLPHLYGTRYFVGDFDGRTFAQAHQAVHWADHGADFYAAQSWTDAPAGRKIWIGWMNNWGYARETPTDEWRGAMSIPREIALTETDDGLRLTQHPVRDIEAWRRPLLHECDLRLLVDGPDPLSEVNGSALEISVLVDAANSSATHIRLSVRAGPDESTEIDVDLVGFSVAVDRFRGGRHLIHRSYSGARLATLIRRQDVIDLRVLVDTTSVEVFAGSGLVSITEQIFPSANSTGLRLESIGGDAVIADLEVFEIVRPPRP
jgi:sucrose-6-phosphate hydrolase SacC (GH32 family)